MDTPTPSHAHERGSAAQAAIRKLLDAAPEQEAAHVGAAPGLHKRSGALPA